MGRVAKPVDLTKEEREELKGIASSGTYEARLVLGDCCGRRGFA
jgi:hypothetical protein